MRPIFAVTFILELPFDLGLKRDGGGLLFEDRGPQWEGWPTDAINQVLAVPQGQQFAEGLGPGTRWMIRRGWINRPPDLMASDNIYADWVEEILTKKQRQERRKGLKAWERRGMNAPVTSVALSRFVGPEEVPTEPGDQRIKPLYTRARADFNRILILLGLVSGHWWIQAVSDRDLPGLVPVLVEFAGPHEPTEEGHVTRKGTTFATPVHDALPNLADREFVNQEDLIKTAELVGAANRGHLPFLPVFEMAHEAGGNLNAGRNSLAVVLCASAVELLVAILIKEGGPLREFGPDRQFAAENSRNFKNLIEHHVSEILAEEIDLKNGSGPWSHWWETGYQVRNQFVHGAQLPTPDEAQEAWSAFDELIGYVQDVLESDPVLRPLHEGMPLGFNSSAQRLVQCIGGGFEAEGFAGSGVEFSRNLI